MSRGGDPCVDLNHKKKRREPNPIKEHVEEGRLVVRVYPRVNLYKHKSNTYAHSGTCRGGAIPAGIHTTTKAKEDTRVKG